MPYKTTIEGTVFRFDDLKELMAKATPERSGDQLAGIAATGRWSGWRRRWRWPICLSKQS
jgi:ethanolamine ammonia-lyase large subunit